MPLYEYVSEQDGQVIELMRPMARADDPVEDPEGRGRKFKRKHSTFAAQSGHDHASHPAPSSCQCCMGGSCPTMG